MIINDSITGLRITIIKVQKDGTKRTFFRPILEDGRKLGNTLFARLGECKTLVRAYIKSKTK